MFKIDKKSEIPLYQQLAHSIKKAVDEQKLKENDKILLYDKKGEIILTIKNEKIKESCLGSFISGIGGRKY